MNRNEPVDVALAALFEAGLPRAPFDEIAASAARAAFDPIGGDDVEGAMRAAVTVAEEWTATLLGARRAQLLPIVSVACHRGCDACCALRVEITGAEGEVLARAIDPERRARVRARAGAVGGLDAGARLRARVPCAMLDEDGGCSVHARRPFVCRAATSSDAARCVRGVAEADEGGAIVVEVWSFAAMRAAYLGFRRALAAWGRDPARRELHLACAESFDDVVP